VLGQLPPQFVDVTRDSLIRAHLTKASSLSLSSTELSLTRAKYRQHSAKPAKQSSFVFLHSLNSFLLAYFLVRNNRVLNITISFGFSVSNFVTIFQLANTVCERFVSVPEQFKAILNE
jgi:hypothetical protein